MAKHTAQCHLQLRTAMGAGFFAAGLLLAPIGATSIAWASPTGGATCTPAGAVRTASTCTGDNNGRDDDSTSGGSTTPMTHRHSLGCNHDSTPPSDGGGNDTDNGRT
jgi:hypothetical protein